MSRAISDGGPRRDVAAGWEARLDERALPAGLLAPLLGDPWRVVGEGVLLRSMGDRRTGRVRLADGREALLKVERLRTLDDRLRALLRPSRARLEWRAARHLHAAGVPVPRPLAVAERRAGRRVVETVFVAEWLAGRRTLLEHAAGLPAPALAALLERVGRLVRAMHAAGFDHRDLHAGNLLVEPGEQAPGEALTLVDLHRGRVGGAPPPAAVLRALARLLVSLRLAAPRGAPGRLALLAGYAAPGEREALAAALAGPLAAFERRHLVKHDAYALREGPFFESLTQGPGPGAAPAGVLRRSFPREELERVLSEHDRALAAHDARVLKDQPKSAVTRHGRAVVKELRPRGLRGLAKRLLAPGRLAAGHRNAHRLDVRGFPTALPLAFVRRDGRVLSVYEDLSAFPRLDHRARALYPAGPRAAQQALRDATADLFARLHAEGVYHGDLKGVNLLVGGSVEAPVLHLVDTDRCRFGRRPLDVGRRLRNVAQLAASLPRRVARSERLRWWRRYVRASGFPGADQPAAERAALARLAALVAGKRTVVDDPLE